MRVDQQAATIEIAQKLSADYPEISFRQANVLEWGEPGAYDIVLCSLALHHFSEEDAVRLLRRCRELYATICSRFRFAPRISGHRSAFIC